MLIKLTRLSVTFKYYVILYEIKIVLPGAILFLFPKAYLCHLFIDNFTQCSLLKHIAVIIAKRIVYQILYNAIFTNID